MPLVFFNRSSLKTKLITVTALIVVVSCTTLSWFFIDREIASMAEALAHNGKLVANNLAETSRHAVFAGDQERLQQLIQGTLISEQVAYVLILSKDGRLLSANGKEIWQQYVADPAQADRLIAMSTNRSTSSAAFVSPPFQDRIIELNNGELLVSDDLSHSRTCWLRLLAGTGHPIVYHLTQVIKGPTLSLASDPLLSLTLTESALSLPSDTALQTPLYGYVLVGISSSQGHVLLRKMAGHVVLIAGIIIAFSFAAGVYLTRHITTPLTALTSLATQVSQGDLSVSLAPSSHDEIGQLTATFNQMTTALKTREDDLKELNRTLESRVNTRTEELQRANQELLKLDRLKTILVSNASHELRTPLTSIKIHVKNLLDGVTGALGTDQLQALGRAHENIERLRTLIDDLLDLSRLQAVGVELTWDEVQLDTLLRDIVEGLRYFSEQKQLAVDIAFSGRLKPISGDRDKLRRALTNVIHNAMKFTPRGKRIRIDAHQLTDESVLVSVEDSGCGIAQEELDKVFLPFFRSPHTSTTTRGSGLGLSIAKELIALHHGTIWAESTAGQGSRFFIRLPSTPQDTSAAIHDTV
ncbi:MAG: HAMP domain-containing histidine kinase [Nitrospira sp.]|nr:HAMP domain-containing histidine kinase [Nitrospira sp.]